MAAGRDLSAHVALVTGASRGIGAAVALMLAEAGAAVAVNYRERADAAEAVVAKNHSFRRSRHRGCCQIVSQAASVAKMVEQVARELGPIDILVNNAGVAIARGAPTTLTGGRFRPHNPGQPEIGLPLHPRRPSCRRCGHANGAASSTSPRAPRAAPGAGHRRRDYNAREGRHGGPCPRLRRTAGQGRHHRQRRRALADRDRHDEAAALTWQPATFRSAASAAPTKSRRPSRMVLGNDVHDRADHRPQRRHGVHLMSAAAVRE